MDIDFVIIGSIRGINFFNQLFKKSSEIYCFESYESYLKTKSSVKTAGKKCGILISDYYFNDCRDELYKLNSNLKIIWAFENPVFNTFYKYIYNLQKITEFGSFSFVIKKEINKKICRTRQYLRSSIYYKYIERYLEYFNINQMQFVLFENILNQKKQVIGDVSRFLNVGLTVPNNFQHSFLKSQTYLGKRILWFMKKVFQEDSFVFKANRKIISRMKVPAFLTKKNNRYLNRFFQPYNKILSKITGINLQEWNMYFDDFDDSSGAGHEKAEPINIILSTDMNQAIGTLVVIRSIVKNAEQPERLNFNILYNNEDVRLFIKTNIQKMQKVNFNLVFKKFIPTPFLLKYKKVGIGNMQSKKRLDNIMNFARFYFHELFPHIDKVIYLDSDILVRADIAELWDMVKFDDRFFASPSNPNGFNAGVYLTDFSCWRKYNLLSSIKKIMKKNKREKVKMLNATQPILRKIFKNNYIQLPNAWNLRGLGDIQFSDKVLNNAKILHWSGPNKPWDENGLNKEFWNEYNIFYDRN